MKNTKIVMQILLTIFCLASFSYAKNTNYLDFAAVSDALGYTISHENFKQKNNKQVDISNVQKKLTTYLKDNGFKFRSIHMPFQEIEGNDLYIEGIILHADDMNRHIETKFKAYCLINNNVITVNNVELKNNTKPRSAFFIVQASKIDINQLKNMNFKEALKKVNSLKKNIESFDIVPDFQPVKYNIFAFMMNKLSDDDEIYSVISNSQFSSIGKQGKILSTKDDWKILTLESTFAYNQNRSKYFNILWQKDDYLFASESYSTQGLIKSIQIALSNQGYDIGMSNGILDKKSKNAINKYLKISKFDRNSKISESLLWFMQRYKVKDVSKIVQATLLVNGINIGKIDGNIGPNSLKGIKNYQKKVGLKKDGKITPELVRLLILTSANVDIYSRLKQNYNKPLFINLHQNKMWPNKLL